MNSISKQVKEILQFQDNVQEEEKLPPRPIPSESPTSSWLQRAIKTTRLNEELESSCQESRSHALRAEQRHEMALKIIDDDEQWSKMKDAIKSQGSRTNMSLKQNIESLIQERAKEMKEEDASPSRRPRGRSKTAPAPASNKQGDKSMDPFFVSPAPRRVRGQHGTQ